MNHIMLDLETLSLADNPVILSIGAVRFDKDYLHSFYYARIRQESCEAVGLHTCKDTLAWWQTQDCIARAEAFNGTQDLPATLIEFAAWLEKDPYIWGNGATADNVWLANAYKACNLLVPWQYNRNRCYRTMVAMCEPDSWEQPTIAHHSMQDAIAQAKTLQRSLCLHNLELG